MSVEKSVTNPSSSEPAHGISVTQAFWVWLRIALLSFGGPAGQIAVMHRILVEEKRWLGEQRFLHALNYCMLLPGPEAQQLATYIGWLLHKTRGGLIAGILFILPGLVAIMALSWLYALFGNIGYVAALFFGLKAAVLAIVLQAVVRISRRALRNSYLLAIAATSFIAIFALNAPFPLIIFGAAIIGWIAGVSGIDGFNSGAAHDGSGSSVTDRDSALGEGVPEHARPTLNWTLKVVGILLPLWLGPTFALALFLGFDHVLTAQAIFFSKMAVVTFGGAYAVLAYVAQQAVEHYAWLQPGEMLDGLGMAETTPGPLIMVTQFVGFMGAYRDAGGLHPLVMATAAALITTWVTFTPCFLWIFLGAPYIEALRGNRALSGALSAITAAVVGVILNLAVWFALHVLFVDQQQLVWAGKTFSLPIFSSIKISALLLSCFALLAVFRLKIAIPLVLLGCAGMGIMFYAIGVAEI